MADLRFRIVIENGNAKGKLQEVSVKGKEVEAQVEKPQTLKINTANAIANLRDIFIVYQGISRVVGQVVRVTKQHTVELKNFARDAKETTNKFLVVFDSIRNKASEVASSLAVSFGMASTTAQKLLGDTGDILVGFGFTEDAALDLSQKVNKLAVDLASFTNYSGEASGASQALTKAILGETESAKSLGIVLRQGTVEFKEKVKALQETEKMTYNQAMATVLLEDAYKQSGKAIGDFARTQHELANQERILSEVMKQFKEVLGERLLPVFKVVTAGAINFFRSLSETPLESTIRELERLGAAAEDIFELKQLAWKQQLIDVNSELDKAGINYEDIKNVTAEIKNNNEQLIILRKREGEFSDLSLLTYTKIKNIYLELGLAEDQAIEKANTWSKRSNEIALASKSVLNDVRNNISELDKQNKNLLEYTDKLIEREALERKINQTIGERTQVNNAVNQEDLDSKQAFSDKKMILDRQSKLESVALLEDKLSEEKKHYEELGNLTAENEKDKTSSYQRILQFEKQIAAEKERIGEETLANEKRLAEEKEALQKKLSAC